MRLRWALSDVDVTLDNIKLTETKGIGVEEPSVSDDESLVPDGYQLLPNYPNPFNPSTCIEFTLPKQQHVTMTIFDSRGCALKNLISQSLPDGVHVVGWDGTDQTGLQVANGIYFCRMIAGESTKTIKMTFIE